MKARVCRDTCNNCGLNVKALQIIPPSNMFLVFFLYNLAKIETKTCNKKCLSITIIRITIEYYLKYFNKAKTDTHLVDKERSILFLGPSYTNSIVAVFVVTLTNVFSALEVNLKLINFFISCKQ